MELCTIPGHFSISLFRELIPQRRKVTHHKKKSLELCMCWVRELCFLQTHTHIYICIQYTTVEVVGDGKVRRRFAITFFFGKKLPKWIVVWEWSWAQFLQESNSRSRTHFYLLFFFFERIFFLFHLVAFCSISVTRSLAALSTNNRWFVFSPFLFFHFFSSLHILCVGRVTLVCEK